MFDIHEFFFFLTPFNIIGIILAGFLMGLIYMRPLNLRVSKHVVIHPLIMGTGFFLWLYAVRSFETPVAERYLGAIVLWYFYLLAAFAATRLFKKGVN